MKVADPLQRGPPGVGAACGAALDPYAVAFGSTPGLVGRIGARRLF